MDDRTGERGETLIEILIALVIMAIAVTAILAEMAGTINLSNDHRSMSEAEVVVRDYGEAIKRKASDTVTFTPCPSAADVTPAETVGALIPGGQFGEWTATVRSVVEYWVPNPASFPNGSWTTSRPACTNYYNSCRGADTTLAACDPGLVRVTYDVTNSSTDSTHVDASGRVLIRRNNVS